MIFRFLEIIKRKPSLKGSSISLIDAIEKTKSDWLDAKKMYDMVTDPDLIDHAIYLIKANEAKYNYLLRKAKEENVQSYYWRVPEESQETVDNGVLN